ncbi:hypothetical protein DWZ37_04790 [Clostridiaceae bacterium AF31-3BH]|nr:hypothetical protein DWZ37_04790 [Clostridiaceae bacterium AF31-3BH]
MSHRNFFLSFLCLLLFLSISTPVFAAEEPDLSGGVITSIPRQRFLENINPIHFYTTDDPEDLLSYLKEQLQNISSLTAIVSKDGQTYETELSLSWSDLPEDVTKAGSYELTGTILPPQGCTFADGVMTSIRIPYIIHDASVRSAIASLFNIQTGITGMIFKVHDDNSWTEQRDLLHSFLAIAVHGLTADGRKAELVLDQFDDHSVNINVPGEYEILISYSLADSCQDHFTFPDDLKTWHIPVKVSDPSVYELWTLKVDNSAFYVTSLTKPASDAKLFWLKSETKLSEEELNTQNWEVFPDPDDGATLNPYLSDFQISRALLTRGIYHYFQVVSSTQRSTILMIQDNGEEYNYENTGGDRDGSSSDDAPSGSLVQPAPAAPQPGPSASEGASPGSQDASSSTTAGSSEPQGAPSSTTAAPSGTTAAPTGAQAAPSGTTAAPSNQTDSVATESFSADQDRLYGVRLNLMRQTSGGNALFSKHGIQLQFSSDVLDQLALSDEDFLTVSIQHPASDMILVSVSKNDEEILSIPDTKITIPWNAQDPTSEFLLQDKKSDTIYTGTYDEEQKLLTFIISKPGTYYVSEQAPEHEQILSVSATEPSTALPSVLPVILSLGAGFSCLPLLRRKIGGVHER